MKLHAPAFWWQKPGFKAWALWPLSCLYGRIAGRRMRGTGAYRPSIPVICVGNVTLGGAGKTPTALALAEAAKAMGLIPGFLSRGYGGKIRRATRVDPTTHSADDVGDEPLLLAERAITVVAKRRAEGARELERQGVNLIIMDDGFQSAQIRIDCAVVVVDSHKGAGNGLTFPAGPLRAPLKLQIQALDAVLVVGDGDGATPLVRQTARMGKPVLNARLSPLPSADVPDGSLKGQAVLAYAGIADPEKFFRTVREVGADIRGIKGFGDHQPLTAGEIEDLLATAAANSLRLVTTAKDRARLRGNPLPAAQALLAQSSIIEVAMRFDDPAAGQWLIRQAQDRFAKKK